LDVYAVSSVSLARETSITKYVGATGTLGIEAVGKSFVYAVGITDTADVLVDPLVLNKFSADGSKVVTIANPPEASPVVRSTGTAASPQTILSTDFAYAFTNEDLAVENYNILGSAITPLPIGWWGEFIVQNAYGMRVSVPAGETILYGPISGTILESFDLGATIVIKKIDNTQWVVTHKITSWSIQ
jgi:hypothetical protein